MPTPRDATRTPRITEAELCAWVAEAEADAILEYHRGFLAVDRATFGWLSDSAARSALDRLAERAHDLAARGLVHLVQRRHGPGDYSYLAVARPRHRGGRTTAPTPITMEAVS